MSLLSALLRKPHDGVAIFLSLDSRLPLYDLEINGCVVKQVKPTIFQRFLAERWLAHRVESDDVVLCFGNLPPLFKLRGRTIVYLQNRYLIDNVKLSNFTLKVRFRLLIERFWLTIKIRNVSKYIVQTSTMKRLMEKKIHGKIPVRVMPFVESPLGYFRIGPQHQVNKDVNSDFIYVASGEPHKNHMRLIEAWCLLAEEGVFPSLCLTLDINRFADLCNQIESTKKRYGLKVDNLGELTHQDVLALYKKSRAAIYPSLFESFGLPLIEARQAGIAVLASELDYVRDVLDPEQVFDPESAISIARAVKRFLIIEEQSLPLLDASEFLKQIMASAA